MYMGTLNTPGQDRPSEQDSTVLEAVVWRKFDIRLLPLCTAAYLISSFDNNNIANARVAGLQTALNISNYQYTVALTVTLVPYIAMELPSNLMLKHVGPNHLLPGMVILWGIIAAMQGLVTSYTGLLLCRFFLGLTEGGLLPGLVLYLSSFYPRGRLQMRISAFFSSASLARAFAGLLAAAITHMDGIGGKAGWAWIFFIEGLFTFFFGIVLLFSLPQSPETASFLSPEERCYVVSKLKSSRTISDDDSRDNFSWVEVLRAIRSPQVLMLIVITFFNGTQVFGLALFEITIVAGLGYTGNQAQLMSVPPFVLAFLASMISSYISDRYGCRGFTVIFFSFWCIIGYSIYYATASQHIRYGSLFFSMTGTYGAVPAVVTWIANNSAPHIRRASSIAFGFVATCSGGMLATWLLGTLSPGPSYKAATITFIVMSIGMVVLSSLNLIYLSHQNHAKAVKRLAVEKHDEPEHLGDRSAWFVYSL
ncbi:major facilitator superfamily domain-containing protein [Pisolithus marmoratus]|nr:major facilitator superfamily domain-containing protein [Pisolithus marmoratus]